MIKVESLLYKIDQRSNKLATNDHQQIPIEDKLLMINEAQNTLVLLKIDTNNVYKLGLDAFKKRYQDLQFLIENPEDHELEVELSDKYRNKYTVSVDSLTPKFMFYIDGYMIASKGNCKDRIIYTNADYPKHADINILLRDSNFKPSFEYQETLIEASSDELAVYTDGTFEPSKLYVAYLRYPKKVRYEGIEDFDGVATETVDCELEDYLEDELLDLVVEKAAMYTENQNAVVNTEKRKQTNE